jgi:hypothetical protein
MYFLESSLAYFLHIASFYFILEEKEVNLGNNPEMGYDKGWGIRQPEQ